MTASNRNHLPLALLVALPLCAALGSRAEGRAPSPGAAVLFEEPPDADGYQPGLECNALETACQESWTKSCRTELIRLPDGGHLIVCHDKDD